MAVVPVLDDGLDVDMRTLALQTVALLVGLDKAGNLHVGLEVHLLEAVLIEGDGATVLLHLLQIARSLEGKDKLGFRILDVEVGEQSYGCS